MTADLFTNVGPIESNNVPLCLNCGWPVYPDNDSGWESFTEDGTTTQPVCLSCWRKQQGEILPKDIDA